MNIKPISIQYYRKNTVKQNSNLTSNPINSPKCNTDMLKYPVSFSGLIPNADLLKNGYKVANVANNRISNQEDSIIITSADNFLALQNSPNVWNKKIVLAKDIDLNGAVIQSIGNASKPFKGEFDGNGCKISNFKIDNPEGRNVGLFGKCENAKISNLEIENAFIRGKQQVGGIAGYATNSKLVNCFVQGNIKGEKHSGGLIGTSDKNLIENSGTKCNIISQREKVYNPFDFDENFDTAEGLGGLIGTDNNSVIQNSYSISALRGNEQIGGFIGYGIKSDISNSFFKGTITGNNKVGNVIGWGENSKVNNSYFLSNLSNYFGLDINNDTSNLFNSLKDIIASPSWLWNNTIWTKSAGKIPRLRIQEKRMASKDLFLEDLNIDIKTGKIKRNVGNIDNLVSESVPLNIFPPKHYSQNDEMIEAIRKCKNANDLADMFIYTVRNPNHLKNPNSSLEEFNEGYDELLLEFVKNPNFDLNKRFEYSYCISCTPLFIISTINKPYILQEALKRDDVDPTVPSGYLRDQTILSRAFGNHIDSCIYVILTSPKMRDIVENNLENLKSMDLSCLSRLLLEIYPNLPQYNEKTGCITFSKEFDIPKELLEPLKEIYRLQDVQKYTGIDENYTDSRNNNIVNVLTTLDDEKEALGILLSAERIGTDINHWNDKFESPIGHALYQKKPHLVANLLERCNNPYVRIDDGVDSMLLFSNLEDTNYSTNYMEIARNRGLSVNSSDIDGNTPLINATRQKNIPAIKYLLSHGANPNLTDNSGQSALHSACIDNNIEVITLLLDSYAYPKIKDVSGSMPIDYLNDETKAKMATKFQEVSDMYEISGLYGDLVNSSPKVNLDNFDEMHSLKQISDAILSCQNADKEILNLTKNILLTPDIINFKDDNGNSILHLIAQSKSQYASECLKAAIDTGADIDSVNDLRETALISALNTYICTSDTDARINLLRSIKILLDSNPNTDLIDENKQSALHKVCQSGNMILFNEILKLNPKINQVDVLGKTPFEYIPPEANMPMYYTAKEYLKNNKIIKEIK